VISQDVLVIGPLQGFMQGDASQVRVNCMAVNSAVRVHTHYRLLDVKTHGQSRHHAWLVQMRDKVGEVEDFKATDFMVPL
jgi:hypothetical protein